MTTRATVWGVLGAALVGAVLLWAFFGSSPEPKSSKPVAAVDRTTVKLAHDDARRMKGHPLALVSDRTRNLKSAVRLKRADILECANVLRGDDGERPQKVELAAEYYLREDGRYDVEVIARDLGEVAFDRCVNAVLESVPLSDASVESIEVDLTPED